MDRTKDEIPSTVDKEEFAEMFIQEEDFECFDDFIK